MYSRNLPVKKMESWSGLNARDGSHKKILDIYNKYKPLPNGYTVKTTDNWCATAVSAAFIDCGYADVFPLECSCGRMIEKAKKMGIWVENDAYIPSPGDAILYDWSDSGKGDNSGWPDHIGMVRSVNANTGIMKVIEGNYGKAVKTRTIGINGRYIRGYITPKFDPEPKASKVVKTSVKAKKKDAYMAGSYKVTADLLNLREDATAASKSMVLIPKGKTVKTDGSYCTSSDGTPWLYCYVTIAGIKYYGFLSSKHVRKI